MKKQAKRLPRAFNEDEAEMLSRGFTPPTDSGVAEWAECSVDFSRAPNYDTPFHGPCLASFIPALIEPLTCMTDPTVHEVIMLKCARAGVTEAMLNLIRYCIAESPQPILYVTGDQLSAESFMERRIVRSMPCNKDTARAFAKSSRTQHEINFPGMDLRVTWNKSRMAFKQDGWSIVICDEFDTWEDYDGDQARKRTASYPFPHVCYLSSPDPRNDRPSHKAPIFVEYGRGDCRVREIQDPKTGEWFTWKLRPDERGRGGVVWDPAARHSSGEWDLDKVRATAHFVTPSGTVIENIDRMRLEREAGRWRKTRDNAPRHVVSFKLTAFSTPFSSGDFGQLAVDFLTAKAKGAAHLRVFIYEALCDEWDETAGATKKLEQGDLWKIRDMWRYPRGTCPGKVAGLAMTVDVQVDHFVWCVWGVGRQDIFLVDHGFVLTTDDLHQMQEREYVLHDGTKTTIDLQVVDTGYRTAELYQYCTESQVQTIPIKGETGQATSRHEPVKTQRIGTYPNGKPLPYHRSLLLRHLHPSFFKDELAAALSLPEPKPDVSLRDAYAAKRLRMWLHEEIDKEFVRQMGGEVQRESQPDRYGKTVRFWKKIHTNNFFDNAQYAMAARFISEADFAEPDEDTGPESKSEKGAAPEEKKAKPAPAPAPTSSWIDPGLVRL